ncbi:Dynein regulatory complex subunit 3 [Schistosoma japonicum]|nr:Dynein regulatory complex subunit 3 [Schistosoma japonicum]
MESEKTDECEKSIANLIVHTQVYIYIQFLSILSTEIFKELLETTDIVKAEDDILDYNENVQQLWSELMRNESVLVEQIDELINEFELNLNDMINTFIENVEGHFTECRELQTQYHEKLTDLCPSILERFMRSDFQSEPSDALIAIFIDKESVTNALTASNDAHLLKIDDFADKISEKAKKWIKETINSVYSGEKYNRNRARVMEINHFIDALRNDVENLDIPALGES